MKTVMVTGGTGFIGSHLVEKLLDDQKNKIVVFADYIDPKSYFVHKKMQNRVSLVYADIRKFDSVFETIVKLRVKRIFHLAAQSEVEIGYLDPKQTLETNIMGTVNVLEAAKLYGKIESLIITSSDKAYGKKGTIKYKETMSLEGDHPYEVSKSATDLIATSYYKTYHLPIAITRFGNVYGEGDLNFSRIIPDILRSLITKEKLLLRSDGSCIRDYLYVKDAIAGFIKIDRDIDKAQGEAYNFSSNDTLSVIQIIKTVEKILRKKIKYKIMNNSINEIPYQSLDSTKAKKLGWQPKYSLSSTIKKVYRYYKTIL
ncbi:MAG: GDP-mannose 4,6-dehydratase [Patescibacteria group bacterium]|nr:GDP-mannose 4,6-dehydratase [Patescibacteria group bacterium]